MGVSLRDYQSESVEFLVPRSRAFIQAPAGSGKTVIGAASLARVVKTGWRVTWIANTREQVDQAILAISRTDGPEGVEFDVCCAAADPDTSQSDVVIFDEAHHAPAASWLILVQRMKPGAILWGLSATPFGEDPDRNQLMRDTFKEFFTITRDRVEKSGHLAPGKVYMHDVDQDGQYDEEISRLVAHEVIRRCKAFRSIPRFEHQRRAQWQITQEFVQQNFSRNATAVGLAQIEIARGSSTLMLVHSIEHGEKLAERVPGAVMCHSKMGQKKRRDAIEGFRAGSVHTLIATSLADEGLDTPRASVLILVAGGRSAGKLEQRAGRVLRPFAGKAQGTVHDFLDRGAAFALAQARARFRVYENLGYNPEIVSYKESNPLAA